MSVSGMRCWNTAPSTDNSCERPISKLRTHIERHWWYQASSYIVHPVHWMLYSMYPAAFIIAHFIAEITQHKFCTKNHYKDRVIIICGLIGTLPAFPIHLVYYIIQAQTHSAGLESKESKGISFWTSLVPRPSTPPVSDHLQYAKWSRMNEAKTEPGS